MLLWLAVQDSTSSTRSLASKKAKLHRSLLFFPWFVLNLAMLVTLSYCTVILDDARFVASRSWHTELHSPPESNKPAFHVLILYLLPPGRDCRRGREFRIQGWSHYLARQKKCNQWRNFTQLVQSSIVRIWMVFCSFVKSVEICLNRNPNWWLEIMF